MGALPFPEGLRVAADPWLSLWRRDLRPWCAKEDTITIATRSEQASGGPSIPGVRSPV